MMMERRWLGDDVAKARRGLQPAMPAAGVATECAVADLDLDELARDLVARGDVADVNDQRLQLRQRRMKHSATTIRPQCGRVGSVSNQRPMSAVPW